MSYKQVVSKNAELVESVILTEQEIKEAILEGKRKKYFKLKHGHLWNAHTAEVSKLKQTETVLPTTML